MQNCYNEKNRLMYILEASFEYLISILVTGSFLATVTKSLGTSDSLTGILSSVISLGCLFQLLSIAIRKTKVKRIVVFGSVINQLLFMLLYVIPLTGMTKQFKIILFTVFIISAYLIYNLVHPKKINWLMSLIDDKQRGRFTANKEIVSLIMGMAFSFFMGALIDRLSENGCRRTAFVISAVTIFILSLLHTLTLLFTGENTERQEKSQNLKTAVNELFKNKGVLKVTAVFVLYNISNYASVPFYGTYQINELGLSLKTVSLLVMLGNLSRIAISGFWGRYADKKSFAAMMEKCLLFLGVAQICAFFAVPKNGVLMFSFYYLFYGAAMGGINSALINLIFDYVDIDKRSDSLAVTQAVSGIVGFLTTLLLSPLVAKIQSNADSVLGINLYAQQFCTLISIIFTLVLIFYIRKVIINKTV